LHNKIIPFSYFQRIDLTTIPAPKVFLQAFQGPFVWDFFLKKKIYFITKK